jgi:DNA (cytosine-5)-methyltransferase 1
MSAKPRLLDLFCGAGGAAMGYSRAGFEVSGVDLNAQNRYPFEFVQADALAFLSDGGAPGFQVIHASPPCQAYSITKHSHHKTHPELVEPLRELLRMTGLPYVIENVIGAPLLSPITLCGTMFDLKTVDTDGRPLVLKRHRLFESNLLLLQPACRCKEFKDAGVKIGGVYGGGSVDRAHAENVRRGGYTPAAAVRKELMGIDWMTQKELNQAIPPAYTEFIGKQLLQHLGISDKGESA